MGKSNSREGWIMVRLRRETHARLLAVRESMELAREIGARDMEIDMRNDKVSLDSVIDALIEFRAKHAERRRRSAARRKKGGAS